jgi:hypothetical protein
MALPMNVMPTYTLTIPSTQKQVKFRPFVVKDQKALLIAQATEDLVVMLDTVKSVIESCVVDKIDVDKLASFDIEYIFAQLRAVSVGEMVDLIFRCDTCEDDKAIAKVRIDLRELTVETPDGHDPKIPLFDDVGVMMKYPSLSTLKELENAAIDDIDAMFNITADCIEYIYTSEELFYSHEQSREELLQFVNNLTADQFNKIENFFRTMPRLRQYVKYTCPVCNKEHNKYLEGLSSFF